MTDSVAVFPPGFRLTDASTGAPLNGAVLRFYDAGTTTPKTVYADAELETSLGVTVTTDSLGYPTSNGTTKTLVYVGAQSYKIRVETSAGLEIATHDNLKGAIEVSEPSDIAVQFARPVSTKSLDYTVLSTDQSSIFAVNCSGGSVVLTLPSAVTVGNGWFITVQHAGSANLASLTTVSSQTISSGSINYGATLPMTRTGEEVTVVSDGGNWRVISHTGPHFKGATGVITIADRLSAPPGSPTAGAWYLLTSSPSGDWSSYAEHDIVQRVGSTWIKITPPADCGWIAFVQDEDLNYQFIGSAWVAATGTTSTAGIVRLADAAAMEAATASRGVTADVQHRHAGHLKAWLSLNGNGTIAIIADYGVSSVTDLNVGLYRAAFDTAFASTNAYSCVGGWARDLGSEGDATVSGASSDTKSTTTFSIGVVNAVAARVDTVEVSASFAGDQ